MRNILIALLLILSINAFGQTIICLNQDFNNGINDSKNVFVKGNLISITSQMDQQTKSILDKKVKLSFTDLKSNQEYVFLDSLPYPKGWLIIDKAHDRVNYIDQETIFVYDNIDKKCLIYTSKNCGFDVFTLSKRTCGFSDPCYNIENGSISITENKRSKRNIKLIIDTQLGTIVKQR